MVNQLKRNVCPNCGKPIKPNWKMCPYCHTDLEKITRPTSQMPSHYQVEQFSQQPYYRPRYVEKKTNSLALASIIMSIIGLFAFGFIGIGGIICGFIALSQLKENINQEGKGMAIAGIVIGFIDIIFYIILIFLWFL